MTEAAPGEHFADGMLSWSPRQITLQPGTAQVVRLMVRKPEGLAEGEYRSHLDFMDLVADQYSFNGHAQRRLAERLKDTLDPNGVLSPGKQGIWPKGQRPA